MRSTTPGSLLLFVGCLLCGCLPRGVNVVSPGDDGTITAPFHLEADSAGSLSGVEYYLVAPSFMVQLSSGSDLGPVDLAPGSTHTFVIHYDIARDAPLKCFRAFTKFHVNKSETNVGIWPDPEDDVNSFDFVVLPSTGTKGRWGAKRTAAKDCCRRLDETEVPNLATACRHSAAAAVSRVETSTAPIAPFFYSAQDRPMQSLPFDALVAQASGGDAAAVLELGFRDRLKSRAALEKLLSGPTLAELMASIGTEVYNCDGLIKRQLAPISRIGPAVRLALARLGEGDEGNRFARNLESDNPEVVLQSVSALGYIGDAKAESALARRLAGQERPSGMAFTIQRALEGLHPDIAAKIDEESEGPDQRFDKWRVWARERSR